MIKELGEKEEEERRLRRPTTPGRERSEPVTEVAYSCVDARLGCGCRKGSACPVCQPRLFSKDAATEAMSRAAGFVSKLDATESVRNALAEQQYDQDMEIAKQLSLEASAGFGEIDGFRASIGSAEKEREKKEEEEALRSEDVKEEKPKLRRKRKDDEQRQG